MDRLTPERLIQAYSNGIFPMAHPEADDAVYWHAPDPRAILPIEEFHLPKNLVRRVRKQPFKVVCDRDFGGVIQGCADRTTTWISQEIMEAYIVLHDLGYAHSVECWLDGELAGGLYGVALQGAFFGESMFHRRSHASKVALVHLLDMLQRGGFILHDIQYMSAHMKRFGAIEIPKRTFMQQLDRAMDVAGIWQAPLQMPRIV